jgi:tetratricopeptide (TPR) repeat protein
VDQGYVYFKVGRYKQAAETFTRALEMQPNNARAIILQGSVFESMKQYEKALVNFTRAVELRPQSAHELGHRGQVYTKLKQYEAALADFNRAIELEPNDSWLHEACGRVYLSLGEYSKAITNCSRAIELNPKNPTAHGTRGSAYSSKGCYDEALKDFERAMELDSDLEHQAQADIGSVFLHMHRYQEAAEAFLNALVAVPACEHCWRLLAKTYKILHSDIDVPKRLLDARVPNDSTPPVIACRASAMNSFGYYKETLAELKRVLTLD